MPFFHDLLFDHPGYTVLALLQGTFTIWMLIDCRHRGEDQTWFWVILWFQPLGSWAYFLMVKLRALRVSNAFGAGSWAANLFQRRASLDQLRYQAEKVPTLTSRLALAERLIEKHEYQEAIPLLEAALEAEPGYGQVCHSLALCHLRLGKPELAIPLLADLLRRNPRWRNYDAWRVLIEAQVAHGEAAAALGSCRELARYAPTLENHCLLAQHLLLTGQAKEARLLLDNCLRDYQFTTGAIRRRNRRWAGETQRLLKTIEAG